LAHANGKLYNGSRPLNIYLQGCVTLSLKILLKLLL